MKKLFEVKGSATEPTAPNAIADNMLVGLVATLFDDAERKSIMDAADYFSSTSVFGCPAWGEKYDDMINSMLKKNCEAERKDQLLETANDYFNLAIDAVFDKTELGKIKELMNKLNSAKNDVDLKLIETSYEELVQKIKTTAVDTFACFMAPTKSAKRCGLKPVEALQEAMKYIDDSIAHHIAEAEAKPEVTKVTEESSKVETKPEKKSEAKKPETKESKPEKKEEDKPEVKATSESVKADEIPQPAVAAVNMGAETHNPTSIFGKFINPKPQPTAKPQTPSFNQFVSQPVAPVQQTPIQTQAAPQQEKKVIDNIQGKLADTAWAPNMFNTKSLAGHSIQEKAAAVKKYMRLIDGSHPGVEESRVDSLLYLISHTKLLRDAEELGVKIPQPFRGFKFNEIALDTYMDEAIKASSQKSAGKCDFAFRLNLKAADGGSIIVYYNTHQPKPGVTKAPTVFKVNGTEGFVMLGKKKHGNGCNCGNC